MIEAKGVSSSSIWMSPSGMGYWPVAKPMKKGGVAAGVEVVTFDNDGAKAGGGFVEREGNGEGEIGEVFGRRRKLAAGDGCDQRARER